MQDWLQEGSDDKGKGRADGHRLNPKAVAAAEAVKHDAELRAMFVVVPPGDEAKPISCPICKETLKSEFMEDDEEWVWRNAVKRDDRVRSMSMLRWGRRADLGIRQIFHATCHAEASKSKSSLASRLKTEMGSRSRSGTPETLRTPPRTYTPLGEESRMGSASPSKLLGTKRKAEEEVDTFGLPVKTEGQRTPPAKKFALTTSAS